MNLELLWSKVLQVCESTNTFIREQSGANLNLVSHC
jgi:hypothetical protein